VGVVLILTILAGALWTMTTAPLAISAMQSQQIRQDLNGATKTQMTIEPGAGYLSLKKVQEPGALIMGSVPASEVMSVEQKYSVQDGTAKYELRSSGDAYRFPNSSSNVFRWDLGLAIGIPIDLKVNLAAGEAVLDLSGLEMSAFQYDMGVGQATITLPTDQNLSGKVDGAIGRIVILVPSNIGLQTNSNIGLVIIQVPQGFVKNGSTYTSANYSNADTKINLDLSLAIGEILIREQ
jgi:hypothetical protein